MRGLAEVHRKKLRIGCFRLFRSCFWGLCIASSKRECMIPLHFGSGLFMWGMGFYGSFGTMCTVGVGPGNFGSRFMINVLGEQRSHCA
jgi:hypothetical protein